MENQTEKTMEVICKLAVHRGLQGLGFPKIRGTLLGS